MMVFNLSSLLSLPSGSRWAWLVLAIVIAAALAGALWGIVLRSVRPRVWAGIGAGTPTGTIVKDDRLSQVRV